MRDRCNAPTLRHTRLVTLLPLLTTLLVAAPVGTRAAEKAHYDFDARSATVEALLTAQQRLAKARGTTIDNDPAATLLREARQLQNEGNQTLAFSRLDEAYQLARLAVRALAETPTATGDVTAMQRSTTPTTQRQVATLTASVKALLEAYARIAAETGSTDSAGAQARVRYEHALDLVAQGKEDEALPVLKHAYTQLQQTIIKLRGGRVLVRELKFDTPADEYWYEVDRLNTHMMLVKLLLDEPSLTADRRVQEAIDGAMKLNWAAQMDAAAGDYPKAIRQLEQATQGLFRVIMAKGFDIPG